ncbi:UPF0652 protein [Sphaceloma murrayae]|uniref:UPF0652 protein n=1 Tax=Sphaceloma murrayae TaxID=2082308 RepID=A0A2K1QJ00_9PEZI|nr:UPF0652 protein [Sphaceloma murrayae]
MSNDVKLIPWDANDDNHFNRLHEQQAALGWFPPVTETWRSKQLAGERVFFWIVSRQLPLYMQGLERLNCSKALSEQCVGREVLLEKHFSEYPADRPPIYDTARKVLHVSRTASEEAFHPLGYVALDSKPPTPADARDLPVSTWWIKSLYVSWALQNNGIGKKAMNALERVAVVAPFNATQLALEAITKEFANDEVYLARMYDEKGLPRPSKTNEEWYKGLGYVEMDRLRSDNWSPNGDGETVDVPLIRMRRIW